ncbi:unnamed protein product, partial [Mesorhabditis belari]|uniref:MULE transposase domain-containing protein n=1 Tax=Mesorhabditis belari TaxID=2138241 RepID=A0AAF3J2P6_9BILA
MGTPIRHIETSVIKEAEDHLKPFVNEKALAKVAKRVAKRASTTTWPHPIDCSTYGALFERVDTCAQHQQGDHAAVKIYAHNVGLDLLRKNRSWTADGTFYSCPADFAQLFIIGIQKEHLFLPCVFALLSGKSAQCYEAVFRYILSENIPAPTKLMTDFERAIFQGYQQVYGAGVAHQYCVFHFHQNILRNIKKRGLSSLVQTPFGKGHLQSMMALALVEPQEVPDYFDAVVLSAHNSPPPLGTNFRAVKKFFAFIEKNYVGKCQHGPNGAFRQPATHKNILWRIDPLE